MTNHSDDMAGRALTRRALLIATVAAPLWLRSKEHPLMSHGSMTDGERRRAVSLLEASGASLATAVTGLTDAQWAFRPSPAQWTIADIVDHLGRSEHAVLQLVTQVLVRQPIDEASGRSRTDDDALIAMVRNRDRRFQAIEPVRPDRASASGAALMARFTSLRGETVAYLRQTTDDLRGRLADHPVAGAIDAYQWFLFLGAHTERHIAQLRDVAADAAFPVGDRS